MNIRYMPTLTGQPYKNMDDLANELGVTKVTIYSRRKELEKEEERYGSYAVIKSGGIILINYLAFLDFIKYRDRLTEKNLRKTVPPFDPVKWARVCGWYGEE